MLLERERSLGLVEELTLAAKDGRGTIAAIVGGAGEGKTALLTVAGTIAERNGLCVWRARGSDLESGFALGAVRQLLEPAMHALDTAEREEGCVAPRAWRRACWISTWITPRRRSPLCTACTGC